MKSIMLLMILIMTHLSAFANEDLGAKVRKEDGDQFVDLKNNNFKKMSNQWAPYKLNSETVYTWQFPSEQILNQVTGFTHRPNRTVRTVRRTEKSIIYDVVYRFDQFSRRMTSVTKTKKQTKFLSLLGCSFTYGNGLNDNETLNYYVANSGTEYFPYNYGIGAGALNMHLSLVQQADFMKDVPERTGAFVYIFIWDHVNRATGKTQTIGNMFRTPYFEQNDNGRMVKKGSLLEARPVYTRIVKWADQYFGNNILSGRVFPSPSKTDELYFCKLAVETKKTLEEKFPESPFIFYAHPFSGISEELKLCLLENQVIFVRGKAVDASEKIWEISDFDGHPNGAANKKIAAEILNFLKTYKPNTF